MKSHTESLAQFERTQRESQYLHASVLVSTIGVEYSELSEECVGTVVQSGPATRVDCRGAPRDAPPACAP